MAAETTDKHQRMHDMRQQGRTFAEIAAAVGYASADAARGNYYRWRNSTLTATSPGWYSGRDRLFIPRYDDMPRLTGDWLILADIHLPTTRWSLLDLAIRFGVKHMKRGCRRVLILGDLVNFDAVSVHPHITAPTSLSSELDMAAELLGELLRHFDDIVYVMGNHEDRLLKALSGMLYTHQFTQLLAGGLVSQRLSVALATKASITSDGIRWHCTHQRNYSTIKGRVAAELALKTQTNLIAAHQHHVSIGRDKYNRYSVIDAGGLFDQRRMAYAERTDSTSPTMCNGFAFIRGGTGHLLTPYPSMTDWGLWKMSADADAAIADCATDDVSNW